MLSRNLTRVVFQVTRFIFLNSDFENDLILGKAALKHMETSYSEAEIIYASKYCYNVCATTGGQYCNQYILCFLTNNILVMDSGKNG